MVCRSELQCCSGQSSPHHLERDDDFFSPVSATVGYCDYFLAGSIAGAAGIPPILGTFTVTCILNSGAASCIHPYCDGMVLTAQGSIYHLSNVEVASTATSVFQECTDFSDKRSTAQPASSSSTHQATTEALHAQAQYAGRHTAAPAQVYLRNVDVLAGPMRVSSMSSGATWSGWFTSIASITDPDAGVPLTPVNSTSISVIQPKQLQMKMFEGYGYEGRAT